MCHTEDMHEVPKEPYLLARAPLPCSKDMSLLARPVLSTAG